MKRYMAGEITASDYVRLSKRDTSNVVRREQADRRIAESEPKPDSDQDA